VTTVTPLERNRVNVTFTMTEGDAAKIREIRIVGAQAFTQRALLGLFEQTPVGWLTWYSKSDRYSRAKLNADLEALRAYYVNRGYLEFAVESTQVTISPDKQEITITISIREGQPYTVTAVRLEGDYLGKEDEFKARVQVRPGEPYSGEAVSATVRRFTDQFGLYGYAFARIEQRPERKAIDVRIAGALAAVPKSVRIALLSEPIGDGDTVCHQVGSASMRRLLGGRRVGGGDELFGDHAVGPGIGDFLRRLERRLRILEPLGVQQQQRIAPRGEVFPSFPIR